MQKKPRAFLRFREARRRTLELTDSLSQAQADFSPGRGQWSLGEVMDHLIQVDRVFREEFDELLRRSKKRRGGSVTLIRSLSEAGFSLPMLPDILLPLFDIPTAMAGIFLPTRVRQAIFGNRNVPAKAPRRIEPDSGRPVGDLRRELESYSQYVEALAADNADVEWYKLRYYNPLTGLTNLPGVLSFTASHERRHQQQMQEILEAPAFPTP